MQPIPFMPDRLLGFLHDSLVVIVTAETADEIRVISMRKAEKNEEKIYFQHLG